MSNDSRSKKPSRQLAGSMALHGGTGPITAMCPCGPFLEIYKKDKTFRVETPNSIDPENTNPDAPWVASAVADVGSSNLTISRVLLQARDMLDGAFLEPAVDKLAVTAHLHACKEALLGCESIQAKLAKEIDAIKKQIDEVGIARDNKGRGLNPFPQVSDLDRECGTFLIQTNRVIKLICELPTYFLELDRSDSNLEHLSNRLLRLLGETSIIAEFARTNAGAARYLINLRNYHEHPKETKTVVRNFRVMPNGMICPPVWYLEGKDIDHAPQFISDEIAAAIEFMRDLAESMFIHLLMHRVSKKFPYCIEQVPEEAVVDSLPIRYKLSIGAR